MVLRFDTFCASECCVPVIAKSAIDDTDLETEATRTGCNAYLHKPFPAKLLIGALIAALAIHDSVDRDRSSLRDASVHPSPKDNISRTLPG
jgi:FixJ family two-component response regulator